MSDLSLDLDLDLDPVDPGDEARARVVVTAHAYDVGDLADLLDALGLGGRVLALPGPTLVVAASLIGRAAS